MRVKQVFVDELSMAHTRVQQFVNDVPVFGGEAICRGFQNTVGPTLLIRTRWIDSL